MRTSTTTQVVHGAHREQHGHGDKIWGDYAATAQQNDSYRIRDYTPVKTPLR